MFIRLSVCSPDICVADVDSFVSQRIPDSDGQISPLSQKKGWKKRRMDVKEPSGIRVFITSASFHSQLVVSVVLSVWVFVFRSGRGPLSALLRLFGRSVLRPSFLDSYLQARVAGGAGLHSTPPEREPRLGTVPALPVW